jgi:hypothetical protein
VLAHRQGFFAKNVVDKAFFLIEGHLPLREDLSDGSLPIVIESNMEA